MRILGKLHFSYELLKLLIFLLFFLSTFFVLPAARLLFPYEAIVVFILFLLIQALLSRYGRALPPLGRKVYLALADAGFAIYLSKFFGVETAYTFMLFAALVVVETLALGFYFGLVALAGGIFSLSFPWALLRESARLLPVPLMEINLPISISGLLFMYGLAVIVERATSYLKEQAERTSLELTQAVVDGEVAKEGLVKANRKISTLLKIAESLSSSLEPDELLKNFEATLHESIEFDNFSILVFDTSERCLRALMTHRRVYQIADAPKFPIETGISGYVFSHGKSRLVTDAEKDELNAENSAYDGQTKSLISVPLCYRDEPIGVLNIASFKEESYTQEDLELAEGMAPLLAIAVNNALHFAVMKVASTRDTLTGLYNYNFFSQRLREILETCFHLSKPVSLIMIDIDDFKQINDTYGHLSGNHILAKLGEIFLSFFRRSDVVARYGGEEFAIILPRTPVDITLVLAENLREEVAIYPFRTITGKLIHIAISLGVASTEDETIAFDVRKSRREGGGEYVANIDEVAEKIISNADEALYRSKQRGKNRVSASASSPYPHKDFTEHRMEPAPADVPAIERKKLVLEGKHLRVKPLG